MESISQATDTARYAKCIATSKRIRWDIDKDVLRGRSFDFSKKFLPDGISKVDQLTFLNATGKRLLSQIQGRTYANMFGLVERFINAKVLDVSRDHWLGDQTALEALVRFSDEELKHQILFRRIEQMIGAHMPPGYRFLPQPDDVASLVLGKSTWAVLGLTCHIELFTQAHYRESIARDADLSELYKDVFLYHWREESQHAILDELEWKREDAKLSDAQREHAVNELIELITAIDGLLQLQADADVEYFLNIAGREFTSAQIDNIRATTLHAYRWQYILSGVGEPRFAEILSGLITNEQGQRIGVALQPIITRNH